MRNYKAGDICASLYNGRSYGAAHQALVNAAHHLIRAGEASLAEATLQIALAANTRGRLKVEALAERTTTGTGATPDGSGRA